MTKLKIGLLFVVAIALQLSVFVEVRVDGVAPELLALVAVLAGVAAGPDRGSVIAFMAGLLWDVYLPTPLGLAAITFAVVAYVAGGIEAGLFHDSRVQVAALAFAGTAAAVVGYALLGEVVGEGGLVSGDLLRVALIAAAVNGALAPFVAPAVRWAVRQNLHGRPAVHR